MYFSISNTDWFSLSSSILEECKYFVKKKRFLSLLITDDIEISFDDSDRENSDEENSNEEN